MVHVDVKYHERKKKANLYNCTLILSQVVGFTIFPHSHVHNQRGDLHKFTPLRSWDVTWVPFYGIASKQRTKVGLNPNASASQRFQDRKTSTGFFNHYMDACGSWCFACWQWGVGVGMSKPCILINTVNSFKAQKTITSGSCVNIASSPRTLIVPAGNHALEWTSMGELAPNELAKLSTWSSLHICQLVTEHLEQTGHTHTQKKTWLEKNEAKNNAPEPPYLFCTHTYILTSNNIHTENYTHLNDLKTIFTTEWPALPIYNINVKVINTHEIKIVSQTVTLFGYYNYIYSL